MLQLMNARLTSLQGQNRRFFKPLLALAALGAALAATAMTNPPIEMSVLASQPAHKISPSLFGVFFEDINYAADGGLYAELVQNRSFEFTGPDAFFAWSRTGSNAVLNLESDQPLNGNNTHYLRLQVTRRGDGVANSGFGGIAVQKDATYLFSVYARAGKKFRGGLSVRLENAKGQRIGGCKITGVTNVWNKFTGAIVSTATEPKARLVVAMDYPGSVDLDMVSLFPQKTFKNRPNGLRADLAQMIADLKPSFVRFPGGCIVEGKDLENRYRWKDTLGDVSERKQNWNRWQSALNWMPAPQYYQSYGLGFFEFFQFCEDIGAQPLPVLGCGMSCQFQDAELVSTNSLEPFIQDALDLVEFANGPTNTPWGAKRAAMGHPAPFNMQMIGIGNEQWGGEYFKRYPLFHEAIKAKYPKIQIVTAAGPSPDGKWFDQAWDWFKTQPVDIVDEHYYMAPAWFLNNVERYDHYNRTGPKIFAGEYAAHTVPLGGDARNTFECALAEAAFMTGLERNSDVVSMASYAPLLAKIGSSQWIVDLIWFDNTSVYGTPSYYTQKMFSQNRGDTLLPVEIKDTRPPTPFGGRIELLTYDTSAEFKNIHIEQRTGTNADGSVIYRSTGEWRDLVGQWKNENGILAQPSTNHPAWTVADNLFLTNYTFSLKARKTSGTDGFIIIIRNEARATQLEYYFGGWTNQLHGLKLMTNNRETLLSTVPGSIETGKWYEIQLEMEGDTLKCFLDGKLIQRAQLPLPPAQRLFATASRDTATGQIILKVVNPEELPYPLSINLDGVSSVRSTGSAQTLSSTELTRENSLLTPRLVSPVETPMTGLGARFSYTFEPHSVTILRVQAQ